MTIHRFSGVVAPDDEHNRALVANVHPADWVNPAPAVRYNLVVVGAGTAGLVSAVGAVGLGARVAIVERHLMGGDCLNYGCVPSKALIRSARSIAAGHQASALRTREPGAQGPEPSGTGQVSAFHDEAFAAAMTRLRAVRAGISKHDSARRLTDLGIDVFLGQARFVAADTVDVEGRSLRFTRAVIATGARASAPPIPGLSEAGYLTNETVFSLTERPRRLVVIGAGPIGCELSQAFARFGVEVTLMSDSAGVLPREDPDAAAVVQAALARDGVALELGVSIQRVERREGSRRVVFTRDRRESAVDADEVLVAVGRAPNIDGLDLEAAGVTFDRQGVTVDDYLRTTNARIYAAGDIASRFQFTHAADAMARLVIQNALFFGRKKMSALVVPWCTYTDPELAHVGLTSAEAARRADVRTLTVPFSDLDRAVLDGQTEGFARVHADATGRVLGATMVASHAGDMIGEMSLAMTAGLKLGSIAATIHPYPTQAEAWKKLGDAWNRTRLTPRVRAWFERGLAWRR